MSLTPRLAVVCLAILTVVPCARATAQDADQERIAASFVLALGRTPTAAELQEWSAAKPSTIADLLARHRRQIEADATARRAVIVKAGTDAFGVAPGEDDIQRLAAGTYADMVRQHVRGLAEHPAEYEHVVNRAYRRVLQRDAYSIEVDYWKKQPPLSFALLAACIEDWARRNQPGLMATTGTASASINSDYLATARLSPAVAAEARAAAGLLPTADPALDSAAGHRVVAPAAGQVVSVGGIHFVAAGAASLVPSANAR